MSIVVKVIGPSGQIMWLSRPLVGAHRTFGPRESSFSRKQGLQSMNGLRRCETAASISRLKIRDDANRKHGERSCGGRSPGSPFAAAALRRKRETWMALARIRRASRFRPVALWRRALR